MGSLSVGVIVVAAGSSRRMGGADKLWIDLGGRPLLERTIAALTATPNICRLVVVAGPATQERMAQMGRHSPWSSVDAVVPGGPTRQDSVFRGLQALPPCDLVLIHDGARPLVSAALLTRAVSAAHEQRAVIAATLVTDTVKMIDPSGRIVASPERASLRAAQTPQVFAEPLLRRAYDAAGDARAACTDDAAVVALAGHPVYVVEGERENVKVSTPSDVAVVRALWAARHGDAGR